MMDQGRKDFDAFLVPCQGSIVGDILSVVWTVSAAGLNHSHDSS